MWKRDRSRECSEFWTAFSHLSLVIMEEAVSRRRSDVVGAESAGRRPALNVVPHPNVSTQDTGGVCPILLWPGGPP